MTQTAAQLLAELDAMLPQVRAVGVPAPVITDSAWLDARDRVARADQFAGAGNKVMADASLALANEARARVKPTLIASVPPAQLADRGKTKATGVPQEILLEARTYEFSDVRLTNVIYRGIPGRTKVRAPDGKFAFIINDGGRGEFRGIMFDGSAVTGEGRCTIIVDGCDCTNFTRGVNVGFGAGTAIGHHNNGLTLVDSSITNTRFHDSPGGWAFGCFRYEGLTYTDNAHDNILNGPKSNNGGATSLRGVFKRNYYNRIRRMFTELQGQVDGHDHSDDYCENQVLGPNFADNTACLGYSEIYHGDKTRNSHIYRNYVNCPQTTPGDNTGTRLFIEHGNNSIVEDNYIDDNGVGTMSSCFMGDSSGPRDEAAIGSTQVRNNRCGARYGQGSQYGQWAKNATYTNNTRDVKVTWDINRPKPGPGTPDTNPNPEPPMDSPDGTYVKAGGTINAGGHAYTIVNSRLARDGVRDPNGGDVVGLMWFGGKLYKDQGGPTWWVADNNPPEVGGKYSPSLAPRVNPDPDPATTTTDLPLVLTAAQALAVRVTVTGGKPVKVELK